MTHEKENKLVLEKEMRGPRQGKDKGTRRLPVSKVRSEQGTGVSNPREPRISGRQVPQPLSQPDKLESVMRPMPHVVARESGGVIRLVSKDVSATLSTTEIPIVRHDPSKVGTGISKHEGAHGRSVDEKKRGICFYHDWQDVPCPKCKETKEMNEELGQTFRQKQAEMKHKHFGGRLNVEYPNRGWNVPNLLEALKTAQRKQREFTWPRILGKYAIGILIAIGTYFLFANL